MQVADRCRLDVELARTFLAVVETGSFSECCRPDQRHPIHRQHPRSGRWNGRSASCLFETWQERLQPDRRGAAFPAARAGHRAHLDPGRSWNVARSRACGHGGWRSGRCPAFGTVSFPSHFPAFTMRLPQVAIKATSATSDNLSRQLADGQHRTGCRLSPAKRRRPGRGEPVRRRIRPGQQRQGHDVGSAGPGLCPDRLGAGIPRRPCAKLPRHENAQAAAWAGHDEPSVSWESPASGYFPRRIVEPEVRRGWLRVIDHAPTFAYAAYAMYNSGQPTPFVEEAAHYLRQVAHAQFG